MGQILIKLLTAYKVFSSFLWRVLPLFYNSSCRFYPSCSEYSAEAVAKYGILRGILKSSSRILRCNPLARGGVDFP